jgi:probable F420-dependent oxidoreductase
VSASAARIWIRLFGFPLEDYAGLATRCDELGFQGIWIPDHLITPLEFASEYPYRDTGKPRFDTETPFADPLVMLGHLAAVTTRVQLGVGVYVLPLRHPVAAAKAIATVQALSGGRLLLGTGAGWLREEFETVDEPFDRRGARAEEMLDVMRRLWTGEPTAYEGTWYRFGSVQMTPAVPAPAIVIGGSSAAAIRRAARIGDGWYAPPTTFDELVPLREAIEVARRAAGTADRPFRIFARVPGLDAVAAYVDAGFADLVLDIPRDLARNEDRRAWLDLAAELIA